MGERAAVARADRPRTVASLTRDLRALGVRRGDTLLVHSSLSSLGWVAGGAEAVIQALLAALGPRGTLVMPAFSSGLSEPSRWENPPVPRSWWPAIRAGMPAFDPARTPSLGVGRIPELFRTWPGVLRSGHPTGSFAARGPRAAALTAPHGLDFSFGPDGPLGRLEAAGARILLLGVGWDRCTAFHLAETRSGTRGELVEGSPVRRGRRRVWATYRECRFDAAAFPALGRHLERAGLVRRGRVGSAAARLVPLAPLVERATAWFRRRAARPPEP